ncbi:hypothetical protein E2C01_099186 [Portunus trituberculatus]|uniref:Uncharacterized protein n=1 Tax=Portunus trituberculatus TaxID=210409 RepID=A0A5B7KG65_PORTR|nr:hypothetical protein [Portunus trituberculatus]
MWAFHGNLWALEYLLSQSPPARKPLARVRKPNLHSDRGQDSNPCSWRPLGPQSTHGSTVPGGSRSVKLRNSLPASVFPSSYDLNLFK